MNARARLRVTGTVQGVGFRPFVYRHAVTLGLAGFVRNDSAGVVIEVEGDAARIIELERLIVDDAPALAQIASLTSETIDPQRESSFRIDDSDAAGQSSAPITVDTATCAECLAEVDDPTNRRFRYPFTNCTNCGPRYTIVQSIPYDRPATTMASFVMCDACQAEYDDPTDRRFHAQPNACPECGPQLRWSDRRGGAALDAAMEVLRNGGIIGVKGIGGYHLACDATDASAVRELRRRKARDDKPFAVMVRDADEAVAMCAVDVDVLVSHRRPIVLARRHGGGPIVDDVAPGLPELGLLLPYSPLHHLLLRGVERPLVMTSGNVSDEPIAHEDDDAACRLDPMVDGLLTHDRPIHIRCDDSVVRATDGRAQVLRRSRGYAPEPIALPGRCGRAVLALGAELKSTIAVARDRMVVASHHIGDLEHLATYRSFVQAIDHLRHLYEVVPDVVAHDLHPEYVSSKLALELDWPTIAIQHHHAHAAACMVDHGRVEPVVAIAFDGLGYGTDGTLWGGEFLVADFARAERVAHLRPVTMPGGAAAIREPRRMAVAWGLEHDDVIARLPGPSTTSVGRLFDAVGAFVVGQDRVSYEAQAAIALEALAHTVDRAQAPTYDGTVTTGTVLDPSGLLEAIAADLGCGVAPALVAAGFHEAIGRAAAAVAITVACERGIDAVALTGGVFQNVRLTEVVRAAVEAAGLQALVHERIPANDGGISIGQAAIAAFA